jgi:GAF domain-containing protein
MAADAVFASLAACVDEVEAWAAHPDSSAETPPVFPDKEQARAAALRDLGLASGHDRRFDEASKAIAHAFGVPIALVSLGGEVDHSGNRPDEAGTLHSKAQSAHESLDAHVVATGKVLVVQDVTEDKRFADDPLVLEKGIRFYAGAPLRAADGVIVGALCVIDTKPREFTEADQLRLQEVADALVAEIERGVMSTAGGS